MKLVADANVLFSALTKAGLTREVWFDRRVQLYAPLKLLEEYKKYAGYLRKRAKLSEEGFAALTFLLLGRVRIISTLELLPYAPAANYLITDWKDAPYVACALAVGADLWSRDRHLRQPRIKCWSTQELAEELELIERKIRRDSFKAALKKPEED